MIVFVLKILQKESFEDVKKRDGKKKEQGVKNFQSAEFSNNLLFFATLLVSEVGVKFIHVFSLFLIIYFPNFSVLVVKGKFLKNFWDAHK